MVTERARIVIAMLALTGVCFAGPVLAGSKRAATPPGAVVKTHVWYDGEVERVLAESPDVVAEFTAEAEPEMGAKRVYPAVVKLSNHRGGAHLWRLGAGVKAETAIPTLKAVNPKAKISAVLHDGGTPHGRIRALPGNIIVYFKPSWDGATIKDWLGKRNLQVDRKLDIGPNIYVIRTAPGLVALDTANAIYKSGEVVAAFPDWWEEVATR